jgi:hypothetical protein
MQRVKYRIIAFILFVLQTNNYLFSQSRYENSPFYKNIFTVGGSVGTAHYIGDLSPKVNFRFFKPSANLYLKKTFFPHDFTVKLNYNFSFLSAADKYSKDVMQQKRNLDFSTSVHELSLSIQTGLYKFKTYKRAYSIYMSAGIGTFMFNPYTFDGLQKVYLRDLGTEGQFSYLPVKAAPYSLQGISFPLGIGIQSNKKSVKTWHLEFIYRVTNTGYLDDVYSRYAGFESFQPSGSLYNSTLAAKLQNRSKSIDFGSRGTSRGNGKMDHFFTINLGMDIQLWKYVYKYRVKYYKFRINPKVSPDDDIF